MFKCGIHVAIYRVVLETPQRVEETEKKDKTAKAFILENKAEKEFWVAMLHFVKWKKDSKPEQRNCPGRADFKKPAAVGIVRLLVSRISPKENTMKYDGKKVSIDHLMAIQGEMTWFDEMQLILDEEAGV